MTWTTAALLLAAFYAVFFVGIIIRLAYEVFVTRREEARRDPAPSPAACQSSPKADVSDGRPLLDVPRTAVQEGADDLTDVQLRELWRMVTDVEHHTGAGDPCPPSGIQRPRHS